MKPIKISILAVLAGVMISLGGTVFLSLENKVLGACFFTIGLLAVCVFGFNLYTGKVCYVFENGFDYALGIIIIWFGNLIGCMLVALLEKFTRIGPKLYESAQAVCAAKLSDNVFSLFILGIFCNICIYIGVEGYKTAKHEMGKYLSIFFGVVVFILCGFEHCVADMYYFSMAGAWSFKTFMLLIVITLGNAVGGVCIPLLKKLAAKYGD